MNSFSFTEFGETPTVMTALLLLVKCPTRLGGRAMERMSMETRPMTSMTYYT